MTTAAGVVLAAGAGTRMGTPKALLVDAEEGSWLASACATMTRAGLAPVLAVLGAAPGAAALLDVDEVDVVVADDWRDGIDASLAAALRHLTATTSADVVSTAVISLVDLPDVTPAVVRRVLGAVGGDPAACGRATYAGRPGHPVVLGRDHWGTAPTARRALLSGAAAVGVECGDLATGADRDRAADLPAGTRRLDPATGMLEQVGDLPGTNRA